MSYHHARRCGWNICGMGRWLLNLSVWILQFLFSSFLKETQSSSRSKFKPDMLCVFNHKKFSLGIVPSKKEEQTENSKDQPGTPSKVLITYWLLWVIETLNRTGLYEIIWYGAKKEKKDESGQRLKRDVMGESQPQYLQVIGLSNCSLNTLIKCLIIS